jgi:hypothetical protein
MDGLLVCWRFIVELFQQNELTLTCSGHGELWWPAGAANSVNNARPHFFSLKVEYEDSNAGYMIVIHINTFLVISEPVISRCGSQWLGSSQWVVATCG